MRDTYEVATAAAASELRRSGDPEAASAIGTEILDRAPRMAMDEDHRFKAVNRSLKICARCSLPRSAPAHRRGGA